MPCTPTQPKRQLQTSTQLCNHCATQEFTSAPRSSPRPSATLAQSMSSSDILDECLGRNSAACITWWVGTIIIPVLLIIHLSCPVPPSVHCRTHQITHLELARLPQPAQADEAARAWAALTDSERQRLRDHHSVNSVGSRRMLATILLSDWAQLLNAALRSYPTALFLGRVHHSRHFRLYTSFCKWMKYQPIYMGLECGIHLTRRCLDSANARGQGQQHTRDHSPDASQEGTGSGGGGGGGGNPGQPHRYLLRSGRRSSPPPPSSSTHTSAGTQHTPPPPHTSISISAGIQQPVPSHASISIGTGASTQHTASQPNPDVGAGIQGMAASQSDSDASADIQHASQPSLSASQPGGESQAATSPPPPSAQPGPHRPTPGGLRCRFCSEDQTVGQAPSSHECRLFRILSAAILSLASAPGYGAAMMMFAPLLWEVRERFQSETPCVLCCCHHPRLVRATTLRGWFVVLGAEWFLLILSNLCRGGHRAVSCLHTQASRALDSVASKVHKVHSPMPDSPRQPVVQMPQGSSKSTLHRASCLVMSTIQPQEPVYDKRKKKHISLGSRRLRKRVFQHPSVYYTPVA